MDDGTVGPVTVVGTLVAAGAVVAVAFVVLSGGGSTACACPPEPSFEFEYDPDRSPSLSVVYAGGEKLRSENLELIVLDGDGTVRLRDDRTFVAGDQLVASTRGLDPGDRVRVVWHHPEADRSRVLAEHTVGSGGR